jgi:hypothetical protein
MADDTKGTNLLESALKALSVPGGVTRRAVAEIMDPKLRKRGSFLDIITGEEDFTAREFLDTVEDKTGLRTKTGNAVADFGIELAADIVTSPDSVFGLPAKLSRVSKLSKGLSPLKRKMLERGITGGTIGAAAINEDDDFLTAGKKLATGVAIGGLSAPVVKGAGKLFGTLGDAAVEGVISKANPELYADIKKTFPDLSIGEAFKRSRSDLKKLRKFETAFVRGRSMAEENLTAPELEIYDDIINRAFTKSTNLREDMFQAAKKEAEELGVKMPKEKLQKITEKVNTEIGEQVDGTFAKMIAEAGGDLQKIAEIENVEKGVNKFRASNQHLIKLYNNATKQSNELAGFDFHTVNIKEFTDDVAEEVTEEGLKKSREGFQKLGVVDDVDTAGLTREQARAIGAKRYAMAFAEKKTKDAIKIITAIQDAVPTDASFASANKFLKGYDQFIQFLKTNHLATGYSWVTTNVPDNIIRAYLANGPKTAAKVAGQSLLGFATAPATFKPLGAAVGATAGFASADEDDELSDILLKMTMGGAAGLAGAKVLAEPLEKLTKSQTITKLMKAFDPKTGLKHMDFDDEYLEAAAQMGAIDSNKFIDSMKLINEDEALFKVLKTPAQQEEIIRMMNEEGILSKGIRAHSDFFWNKFGIGSLGSATEGSARAILFKDATESLLDQYKGASKAMKRWGPRDIQRRVEFIRADIAKTRRKVTDRDIGILGAHQAMVRARNIVNDTFFDYQNVSLFEQSVMKRIFPYWTFFSRNFDFWLNKAFDPNQVGKVSDVSKVLTNLGDNPTDDERLGIPDFALKQGARVVGREN